MGMVYNGSLVLVTASVMKGHAEALCLSAEGKELWSWKSPEALNFLFSKTYTLRTPDASYIYVIQYPDNAASGKTIYVNRLTKEGVAKTFEIKARKEWGESLLSMFCDNEYMYILATKEGNEQSAKKKTTEKLILNRFNHSDLGYQRFELALPAVSGGDNVSFWSLIGQRGSEKFLASKSFDNETGKIVSRVVSIDSDGKQLSDTSFETALQEGVFLRPCYSVFGNASGVELTHIDYEERTKTNSAVGDIPATMSTFQVPLETAFSHVVYSVAQDCFYSYGLTGTKAFKQIGSEYNSFYVQKFDRGGKLVWKIHQPVSKQLFSEPYFRVHGTPADRRLMLHPTDTDGALLVIGFQEVNYFYSITKDAATPLPKHASVVLVAEEAHEVAPVKSGAHLDRNKSKAFWVIPKDGGELVAQWDLKGGVFDLLYFK
jgi:hypothetical protein